MEDLITLQKAGMWPHVKHLFSLFLEHKAVMQQKHTAAMEGWIHRRRTCSQTHYWKTRQSWFHLCCIYTSNTDLEIRINASALQNLLTLLCDLQWNNADSAVLLFLTVCCVRQNVLFKVCRTISSSIVTQQSQITNNMRQNLTTSATLSSTEKPSEWGHLVGWRVLWLLDGTFVNEKDFKFWVWQAGSEKTLMQEKYDLLFSLESLYWLWSSLIFTGINNSDWKCYVLNVIDLFTSSECTSVSDCLQVIGCICRTVTPGNPSVSPTNSCLWFLLFPTSNPTHPAGMKAVWGSLNNLAVCPAYMQISQNSRGGIHLPLQGWLDPNSPAPPFGGVLWIYYLSPALFRTLQEQWVGPERLALACVATCGLGREQQERVGVGRQ